MCLYRCGIILVGGLLLFAPGTGPAAEEPGASEDFLKVTTVTASSFESKAHGGVGDFPPEMAIDGDLSPNSSWRAEVKDKEKGEWIQFDLGAAKKVSGVQIAFFKSEERVYEFVIEVSEDGKKWTEVSKNKSGGKEAGFETFPVKPVEARHVRLRGFGNNSEKFHDWFNILEVQILPAKP